MHIDQARALKTGQRVHVPEDNSRAGRPSAAYVGIVEDVGKSEHRTHAGDDSTYIWVLVQHPRTKRDSMWPSNRLEVAAPNEY